MKRIGMEEYQQVITLLMEGKSITDVVKITGRSRPVVSSIRRELDNELESKSEDYGSRLQELIEKNWPPRMPAKPRIKRKNGYRVVYPGDRGIRTPYRPDGIWH